MPNGLGNGTDSERPIRTLSWDEASLFVLQELKRLGKNQDETHMMIEDIRRGMEAHERISAKDTAEILRQLEGLHTKSRIAGVAAGLLGGGAISALGAIATRILGH